MRAFLIATLLFSSLMSPRFAFAAPKNLDVKIEGMTCDSCVQMVKSKLLKVPNVDQASVKVVLKEKHATLQVADADATTVAAIKKAVADAGYSVVGEPKVTN